MKTLVLLQAAAASSNQGGWSFWLMLCGICTIAYLCVRYLKKGILPDKKNEFDDIQPSSQQPIARNTSVHKPINKSINKSQQLKELKEMLDNGILTEEEFKIEKAKILSAD